VIRGHAGILPRSSQSGDVRGYSSVHVHLSNLLRSRSKFSRFR